MNNLPEIFPLNTMTDDESNFFQIWSALLQKPSSIFYEMILITENSLFKKEKSSRDQRISSLLAKFRYKRVRYKGNKLT